MTTGNERLYFLHIPKTGGTTLRAWLETHFPAGEVLRPESPERLFRRGAPVCAGWRFASGHYGMMFPALVGDPCRVVTMLREPLARSVSHYRDIRSRPKHPLFGLACGMSFEQFVLSDEGDTELRNLQCRFLALDDAERDFWAHATHAAGDVSGLRRKYADPELLVRATRALERIDVVGVCERFGESVAAIAGRYGWAVPPPLPQLNRASEPFDTAQLTERAKDRVRELTALDLVLYETVSAHRCLARPELGAETPVADRV